MKIKRLWVYILWRVAKVLLLVATAPVWLPLGIVLWVVVGICAVVADLYNELRLDWIREGEDRAD